jgi:hypothetical protein
MNPYEKLSRWTTNFPFRKRNHPIADITNPAIAGVITRLIPCRIELRINASGKTQMLKPPIAQPTTKNRNAV